MRLVAVLACGAVCACSMTFVDRAPRRAIPGDPIECTSSQTWPVVDALLGATTLIAGILEAAGVVKPKDDNDASMPRELSSGERVTAGVGGVVYAAMFAYSSYWGFGAVAHCREIQRTNPPYSPELYPEPVAPIPQSGPPGGVQ